jgi:hypothetical protein
MGDFGVACAASNFTISFGKAKLIILIPCNPKAVGRDAVFSFDDLPNHPASGYTAFCMPLTGTYNSYGRLEEIERTPTVDILEKYFGMDIDHIVDIVCDLSNQGDIKDLKIPKEKKEILGKLSPCFVIDSIYHKFNELFRENESSEILYGLFLTLQGLADLGFKKQDSKDRCLTTLVNERYPKYTCTANITDSMFHVYRRKDSVCSIKDLEKMFLKYEKKNIFEVYGADKRKQVVCSLIYKRNLYDSGNSPIHRKGNLYKLSDSEERVVNEEYINAFEYLTFYFMMYSANLTLLPKYSGEQYGNPKLEHAIAKAKVDIFKLKKHNHFDCVEEREIDEREE